MGDLDPMDIISTLGALLSLLVGALILNFVSQGLEGRKNYFLHFGFVTIILVVGAAVFPFWGWPSTVWVLGIAALWSILPALWQRFFSDGEPSGYLWHGDDPAPQNAEANKPGSDADPNQEKSRGLS